MRGGMRTLIIITSLVLALTQAGLAAENAPLVILGCRAFLAADLGPQSPTTKLRARVCKVLIVGQRLVAAGRQPRLACVPDEVTDEQAVHAVVDYFEQYPARTYYRHFSTLVSLALQEAWPCKPDQADK
jgi:hypothetical protein